MEVRIRRSDEATARHLTEIPFDQVDQVIPMIKSWGVYSTTDEELDPDLTGQIVLDETVAWFEVVLNIEDT